MITFGPIKSPVIQPPHPSPVSRRVTGNRGSSRIRLWPTPALPAAASISACAGDVVKDDETFSCITLSSDNRPNAGIPVRLSGAESAAPKPNMVFILADDMGYGDPRCFNPQSKIPTPNIDRFAGRRIQLADAHAPGSSAFRRGMGC